MKTLLKNPRSSAITSFILALPFVMIFLLILLNLEPNFGPLEPYLRSKVDQPNVLGSAIVLSAFLLLLAAFAINLVTIVQNVRRREQHHRLSNQSSPGNHYFRLNYLGSGQYHH